MGTSLQRQPNCRSRIATLVVFAALSLCFILNASAQEGIRAPRYTKALIGVSLEDALQQFVMVTSSHISIAWDPLLITGKRVVCVAKEALVDEFLSCILRGTGLDYIIRSNGLYVLEFASEGPPIYGNLRGIVLDFDTEQPVPNATVYLAEAGRARIANQEGMFIFPRLLPGTYHMRVRHLGYRPNFIEIDIDAGMNTSTEVILESVSILITTPIVIDGLSMQPSSRLLGQVYAEQEEFTQNLAAGTAGLLQSLDAMPGVRVNDATSDVHIQGGEAGEHQFRLDGAPVFLPLNVASFIGPFSPFALGKITVHKAGFGASMGSQISGIISAEHDLRVPHGSSGIGSGSQFTVQVDPLSSNGRYSGFWSLPSGTHITTLGAARIGTWSLLAPPALSRLMDDWNTIDTFLLSAFAAKNTPFANLPTTGSPAIQFADLHAATKVRFGALKTFQASTYWGRSSLGNKLADIDLLDPDVSLTSRYGAFKDLYSWQNGMAQARYSVVQSSHTLTSIGIRGSFYSLTHDYDAPDELSVQTTEDDGNHVFEISADGKINYFTDRGQEIELGAELTLTGSQFTVAGTQQFPLFHESAGWRFAAYFQDRLQLGQRTVIDVGARLTWLASNNTLYAEPRLAARMDWVGTALGEVSLFLGSGLYRQFVSQFDISSRSPRTFVSSTRFWMGNDATVTPPKAAHFAAEVLVVPNRKWSVSLESFYKKQYHILSVNYAAARSVGIVNLDQKDFLESTNGYSYGSSAGVKRMIGPGNVKISFDHTISRRRINNLFRNDLLNVPWSEPFRLEFAADIVPAKGFVFLTRWSGSWGRTWGYRKAYYDFLGANLNNVDALLEDMRRNGVSADAIRRIERQISAYDLTSPNAHRLPPIFQLDLSGAYSMRLGNYTLQIRGDIINVLDRQNTADWRFELDEESYFGGTPESATTGILDRSSRLLLPRVFSVAARVTW